MRLRQLVPEEFCLSCDVCCRFPEEHTLWAPLFTESEIKYLVKKDILPPVLFSLSSATTSKGKTVEHKHKTQRINLIAYKDYFICPCFNPEDSKCKIYDNRPFECRLYPFLLVRRNKKSYLALDKKCPYLGKLPQGELKSYLNYLQELLATKKFKAFLKNNPELLTDYPAADLKLLFPIKIG